MKRNTNPWTNKIIALSSLGYALALTAGPAFCSEEAVKLVLGQSPADGGIVTPDTGVHHFLTDATIAITANPQEGYRFSHWLGDVTDPASNTTQIHLNSSKAVMAVYEPIARGSGENGYQEKGYAASGGVMGSGNIIPTRADFSLNGFSAPGGSARPKGIRPSSNQATVPAPVPEPATFILLGVGSIMFARSAKRGKPH